MTSPKSHSLEVGEAGRKPCQFGLRDHILMHQGLVCRTKGMGVIQSQVSTLTLPFPFRVNWEHTPYSRLLMRFMPLLRVQVSVNYLEQCLASSKHKIMFCWVSHIYQDPRQCITRSFIFPFMVDFLRALFILTVPTSMDTLQFPLSF